MVAVIHSSKSLKNALHYNENKVKQKVAKFIHAGNYTKDTHLLGYSDKINRLERLIVLNQQTKNNSVHISLNFDLSDELDIEKLKQVADKYIDKIGFGKQPYLVYQHSDAGHPHIHIITTNIKSDGSRIALHNIGRNQSEKARKEIEKDFKLINAENKRKLEYKKKPLNVQQVQAGKCETKRAITNVLNHILPLYKYTSLAELNAVLQQYNIVADRGSENSRIYQTNGLVYRMLDQNKQKVGIPIKASLIYNKPTLANIEARFERNNVDRQRFKQRVMNSVDFAFLKNRQTSLTELIKAVQKENIHIILRQNAAGVIYGVTYVDHSTKCVFNGSHLGKQYSANGIQQRCLCQQLLTINKPETTITLHSDYPAEIALGEKNLSTILNDLMQPDENGNINEPSELKKFKKRNKRQQHSHK